MTVQQSTVPPILLQALPEEVFFIDEAAGNYILSLERKSLIVDEDEEVLALMKAFRQRYQGFLADGSGRRGALTRSRKRRSSTDPLSLLGWRVTCCELVAFGNAAIAYRRLLEMAQIPEQRRQRALKCLAAFQKRYLDALPSAFARQAPVDILRAPLSMSQRL